METPRFRWTAEFLAGPGGFASKEEISSDWFNSKAEAVNDANKNADNEVQEFPYARNILRLVVVDETGKQMVELRGRSREHWRFSPLNISIVDDVEPVACSTMVCSHDILFWGFSLFEWLEDYVFGLCFIVFALNCILGLQYENVESKPSILRVFKLGTVFLMIWTFCCL